MLWNYLRNIIYGVSYDLLVPDILNIEHKDLCPMEKLAKTSDDPNEIIKLINGFLNCHS